MSEPQAKTPPGKMFMGEDVRAFDYAQAAKDLNVENMARLDELVSQGVQVQPNVQAMLTDELAKLLLGERYDQLIYNVERRVHDELHSDRMQAVVDRIRMQSALTLPQNGNGVIDLAANRMFPKRS